MLPPRHNIRSIRKTGKEKAPLRMQKCFVAPQVGLEPTTLRLTAECSAIELLRNVQMLQRLLHPCSILLESGDDLLSRAVSSQVPSACGGLTSVFGMGTGGSLQLLSPEILFSFLRTFKTAQPINFDLETFKLPFFRSSPRPISIIKLHMLPRFHR